MTNMFLQEDIDQISLQLSEVANALSGKTVLMTGAAGFLGRYFMAVFAKLNADVLIFIYFQNNLLAFPITALPS